MHSGKITVKDCIRLTKQGYITNDKIKLPYFLNNMELYMKALDRIAKVNYIDEF